MQPGARESAWRRWGVPGLIVLGGLGCFSAGVAWVLRSLERSMEWELRRNDVHRLALRAVESSPQAVAVLGSPVSSHALRLGAHGATAEEGRVDFELDVEGPQARGVLEVQAAYAQGWWTLKRLVLRPVGVGSPLQLPAEGRTRALAPR